MKSRDTIVAVATPAGVGGIAVVRLSGDAALQIALTHLNVETLRPRHATYCRFDDLDDGIAVYYPAGYTGEPTVEFSCHGSQYVQHAVVQALIDSGARLAEAGEFTMRAFRNGRLNLSQAEAVADLIEAATPVQHRLAVSQMRGGYAKELELLRRELIDFASLLELELDFGEEDVEFANRERLQCTLSELTDKVQRLVGSFHDGNVFKNGIPVAIVGRPNAGKSSLLNALLAEDRAIVSPVPGTTRDTVEETMNIGGMTFLFIDTAGIHESDDQIESLGFERSIRAAQQAKIILFVRVVTVPFDEYAFDDIVFFTDRCQMKDKHLFIVNNKCDLLYDGTPLGHIVSAKYGTGIDQLKQSIVDAVKGDLQQNKGVLLTNIRHYEAMKKVLSALNEVQKGLDAGLTPDLVVVDLRDALYHLGTITGEVTNDEVLGNIFSRFCIGK